MKTAEEIVKVKGNHMESVLSDDTLNIALNKMVEKKIGAIVVKDSNKVVGIWTERHLMKSITNKEFNLETAIVKDYMTKDFETVDYDEPIYKLSDKMLGLYTRYLFVKKHKKIIGILSSGDIIRACLVERLKEVKSLSVDYYNKGLNE